MPQRDDCPGALLRTPLYGDPCTRGTQRLAQQFQVAQGKLPERLPEDRRLTVTGDTIEDRVALEGVEMRQ